MKKNIRKIPGFIASKLESIDSDLRVEVVFELQLEEIQNRFPELDAKIEEDKLILPKSFFPDISKGRFSKKNVNGYSILRRDLPKVVKTFYCGERHPFGDTSLPEFSLYITKLVYYRDEYGPKNNVILIEILKDHIKDDKRFFVLKFTVDEVLNKVNDMFEHSLLFNLNLLQENIGQIDVYDSNTTEKEYLKTINVAWEILPPGEGDHVLTTIMEGIKKISEDQKAQIKDRYDFLMSLSPTDIIYGLSGMTRYFGCKFSDNLVILENLEYGNALYILFENWEDLSKLSRTELFNSKKDDHVRIVHNKKLWKNEVTGILNEKLN